MLGKEREKRATNPANQLRRRLHEYREQPQQKAEIEVKSRQIAKLYKNG